MKNEKLTIPVEDQLEFISLMWMFPHCEDCDLEPDEPLKGWEVWYCNENWFMSTRRSKTVILCKQCAKRCGEHVNE